MDHVHDDLIRLALREDLGMGDLTSELLFSYDHRSAAAIIAKSPGIISGLALARRVFEMIDDTVEIRQHVQDGDSVDKGMTVLELAGHTRTLLAGERTAINFLMHLSGIATATYNIQQKLRDAGCSVRITDTRKTTPIWRFAEKRAVRDGGGLNHRYSLSDGVLIKDNHLFFYKDPAEAVRCAKAQCRRVDLVEVEVTGLAQVEPCLEAGADIIMLDNMTPQQIRDAVKLIAGRARIEVSGGVNPDNILDYAIEGVDIISLGYLTHSAPSLDFSMEMTREVAD
jgi:nicotinate-nucleotide pyrophosphorylase (carboxylating)